MGIPNSNRVRAAYNEVKAEFPFGSGYLEGKYVLLDSVLSFFPDTEPRELDILSIGSGPCDMEAILSKLGYNVTAVDDLKDPWHQIGDNRERIQRFAKQFGINFYVSDANQDVLSNNDFDVIICLDVIEHVDKPRELLNSIGEYLAPEGTLILATPNQAHLGNRLRLLFGKPISTRSGVIFWNIGPFRSHIKEYTKSEIVKIIGWTDFEILDQKMINLLAKKRLSEARKTKNWFIECLLRLYLLVTLFNSSFKDTQVHKIRKPKYWEPTDLDTDQFLEWHDNIEKCNVGNLSRKEILSTIKSDNF